MSAPCHICGSVDALLTDAAEYCSAGHPSLGGLGRCEEALRQAIAERDIAIARAKNAEGEIYTVELWMRARAEHEAALATARALMAEEVIWILGRLELRDPKGRECHLVVEPLVEEVRALAKLPPTLTALKVETVAKVRAALVRIAEHGHDDRCSWVMARLHPCQCDYEPVWTALAFLDAEGGKP